MVNIMLWAAWYFASQFDVAAFLDGTRTEIPFPWPIFPTVGWGIGLIAHLIEYYSKYGGGAERRERIIQAEIERERARSGFIEKPKNDRRVRLTEDGELEEVIEDYDSAAEKRKR